MDLSHIDWATLKATIGDYADPLTTISIILGAAGAVGVFLRKQITELWKRWRTPSLRRSLRTQVARIREQRTLTRSNITIGNLIEDPYLWVEPRFVDPERALPDGAPTVALQTRVEDLCRKLCEDTRLERVTIVGGPARGKSTLARKLFCELAEFYERGICRRFPIFIDFAEPLLPARDLGDRDETDAALSLQSLKRVVAAAARSGIILITDGLDEALYAGRDADVSAVIKLTGASDTTVTFARHTTFLEFIKYSREMAPTWTLYFAEYDANLLADFARAILEKVFRIAKEQSLELMGPLGEAIGRGVVCAPMHVVMAVENSLHPSGKSLHLGSLASVYGGYLGSLLQRETAALSHGLKSFQVQEVLEHVCGTLVLRVAPGNTFQSPGALIALGDIRAACDAVLGSSNTSTDAPTWIAVRSLLERNTGRGSEAGTWRFSHPSFVDFFVARHVLRQLESDARRAAKLMAVHMPQEVYAFLKMFILLDLDAPRAAQIVAVARTIFNEHLARARQGDEIAELQIEQAIHLVAHIRTADATDLARLVARALATPFVSRGVAIGLSFAGVERDLYEYVRDLEAEYDAEGLGPKNSLNLVHQLAYFGDVVSQFRTRPTDAQIVSAAQVISKQLSQLRNPLHNASRVVDLYTIEVLLRLATSNESLRKECRLMARPIRELLSVPELTNSPSLTRRVERLSHALEALQA